ncbi:MAG: FlgD immunoglobulin-like domain containing protein [Hyphomicrobiales bacterium]
MTLRDARDHAIADFPSDSIDVTAAGRPAAVTPRAGATDGSGAVLFTVASNVAGTATVTVQLPTRGVTLDDHPAIAFDPGPLDHYALSGPSGPLTAGVADTLALFARDAFENPLPSRSGDVLRPTATSGAASLPDSVALSGGRADIAFTPLLAIPLAIHVGDDSSRAVDYGPVAVGAGAPYRLIAGAPPADTLAAGDSTAVTARVFDALGNAAPGATVQASVVQGGGSVAPSAAATDASGAVSFTLHAGATPGAVAFRLLAAGSAADDSIRADSVLVTVLPAKAASVEIVAAGATVTAGDSLGVTLTLRDAYGNVATGATPSVWLRTTASLPDSVSWSPGPGAMGALADSAAGDGARYDFAAADLGVATVRVRATRAETIRLRASGATLPLAESGDVAVTPAAPAVISLVSGDGQTATVAHALPAALRVATRDAFGNATPGASVLFRVVAGNGSVDAVAGGAADSLAVADGSGTATCDVARVGTVAGPGGNAYRASLLAAPAALVTFTASATPDTAATLALAPGDFALAAGQTATVTATARDAYGNAAPGTAVTLYLGSPALGALESLGQTTGSGTTQSGAADASGAIAVRYRAPATAPAADSIYARGVSIAPVALRVTVGASAIASLRIVPDATTWTAGVPSRVRVDALDAFGNVAVGDTATIVMGASDAVSWSPPSGALSGGSFTAFGTATLADTLTLTARTSSGAPATTLAPVTVAPAAPSGAIALRAGRTTLTADGKSSTTVTIGPVRDAYGNTVPSGALLTVSAGSGSLLAADASPLAGLQVATAADDSARVVLTAPAVAGPDTVRASSVAGAASGTLAVTYVAAPAVAFVPGSLAPSIVTPGQTAAFRVRVTNAGGTAVTIGTGSSLAFASGPGAFAASPPSPLPLAPGATDTLRFQAATVSTSLTPGTYAPSLRLAGTDGSGDPFDFYLDLAGAQVSVAGVAVTGVSASPSPVPLGNAGLSLVFDVENRASVPATIDGASVAFTQGAFTVTQVSPALPAALPALGTTRLTLTVTVPPSGIPSGTIVGSRLTASVGYGAVSVTGQNATSLDFQVVSGATLAADPAGTSPSRYLRARTFGPRARVANAGAAAVTLARGVTRLVLTRGPADSLVAGLSADAVVSAGASADLAFDSLAVAAGATKGRYGAWLVLRGSESGQPYAATIPLAPDSVDVVDPALLSVSAPVDPDTVSAGQTRGLSIVVANAGDVPYDLDATSRLSLGAPVSASLVPVSEGTVPAHGTLAVPFAPAPLGFAATPGIAAATLEAHGLEDGRARDASLGAGTLTALAPSALAYVGGSTGPDTLRAGLSYALTASVRNGGGSPFVLDPAATRIVISDGAESAVGLGAGAPVTIAAGATVALTFPSVDLPASLASQAYPVTIVARGTEWGLADSVTIVSPAGEVSVIEPVASVAVRGIDPGAPLQVAAEAGPVPLWDLELTPLLPPGGAISAHLVSISLTVLADGAAAADPSAVLADLTLRDGQGAVLAQAAPGVANPVVLTLATPLALSGAPATLALEATIRSGASVGALAVRVATPTDVVVRDDVSGADAGIVAPGGLPFAPLTSPTVTLFAKPHGYPNPFHAGREAVRLSYRLAADAPVTVTIYTLLGNVVRSLSLPAGTAGGARGLNEVPWDGRNGNGDLVRPGVYVARIEGGGVSERIKVGVLR